MHSILGELLEMLTYCRPDRTDTETQFIDRYIAPLPGVVRDAFGNWITTIGDSPVLWSSHTDTVHWKEGRQTIHYDPISGVVSLSRKAKKRSKCLGADCTVGVWIMRQMILRGIPGTYVFHAQEESGGNGSRWIADNRSEWLQSFSFAIAFDRRGTGSIITEQRYGRTASDLFALSLEEEIARVSSLRMRADNRGIYTDTAEYSHLIAECSNLSVGYACEHSKNETLDTRHAIELLEAICKIDQSQLIADRIPEPIDDWSFGFQSWDHVSDRSYDRPNPFGWKVNDLSGVDAPFNQRPLSFAMDDSDRPCPWHDQGSDCRCANFDHGTFEDACEEYDINPDGSPKRSAYLDPVYEKVQNALALCKDQIRSQVKGRK